MAESLKRINKFALFSLSDIIAAILYCWRGAIGYQLSAISHQGKQYQSFFSISGKLRPEAWLRKELV